MKKKNRKSMIRSLSLFVTICIAVVVLVSQAVNAAGFAASARQSGETLLQTQAKDNAELIDSWLDKQSGIMHGMVQSLKSQNELDHEILMDYLEGQLALNDNALMYYICFAYDKSVNPADHSKLDLDPTTRGWWKTAVEQGTLIYTDPYVDFATGQMIVSIAEPLKIQGKQAVLLADITIDKLVELVSAIRTDEGSATFLLASDGSVLTHPNADFLPKESGNTLLADVVDIDIHAAGVQSIRDYDGSSKEVAIASVSRTGWKLGVAQDITVSRRQNVRLMILSSVFSVILLFFAVALLSVMLRRMLSPLGRLQDDLLKLSQGDFSVRIKNDGREDEIGVLQSAAVDLEQTLSDLVQEMNRVLSRLADYDLTVSDIHSFPGDFDRMACSVNDIKKMLLQMIPQVQAASAEVTNSAKQVADNAQTLAQSTSQQTDSVQRLAAEASEISENISRTTTYARKAQAGTNSTYENIQQCNGHMHDLMQAMSVIEEKSGEVNKVIKTIEDIAFQTNILALNAAVEAARAGAAGKGFAVVADEVRNLANKSAEAAQGTTTLIEQTVNAVANGTRLSKETELALNKVVTEAETILESVNKISDATVEQEKSIRSVTESIDTISGAVANNAASAEESAGASEELEGEAALLKQLMDQFRLEG